MLQHFFCFLTLGVLISLTSTNVKGEEQAIPKNQPQIVAVKFHADWCGSCRKMGSIFEDLATVAEEAPVLFTRLDLTDRSSRTQAAYLMNMLGLQTVYEEAGGGQRTGFILLIDADSQKPVARLVADQDLKQMKATLFETLEENRR